mgnify:CR=1 FL=1
MTVKRRPRSTKAVARERGKQKEVDAPRVVAVQVERVFAEKHQKGPSVRVARAHALRGLGERRSRPTTRKSVPSPAERS